MAGLMLVASISLFSSCEKNSNEPEEPEKTLIEQIQGKWVAEKATWEDGEVNNFPTPNGSSFGIEFKNNELYVYGIKNGKITYLEEVRRTDDLKEMKLLNYFYPDDEMKEEKVTVEQGKYHSLTLKGYVLDELTVTYNFQRGTFSK